MPAAFSIVVNFHFVRFLWALRPSFAKRLTPRTLQETIATDLLDEVYEETKDITAEALSNVPGRLTLGMDGHKEGKHRHVETVTQGRSLGLVRSLVLSTCEPHARLGRTCPWWLSNT